jgi:hypothetical protein
MPELDDRLWVKYCAQHVLVSLLPLSPRAELAHRRLCDLVWSSGAWPDTRANAAAKLARVPPSAWSRVLAELAALGWRTKGHSLTNASVRRPWLEATRRRISAAARGKTGGEARWQERAQESPARSRSSAPNGSLAKPKLSHSSAIAELKRVRVRVRVKGRGEERSGYRAIKKAERLTFSPSARQASAPSPEQEYLADVAAVMALASPIAAEKELDNWGGWWRNRYRENPDKSRRVLAEVRSMIRERRVTTNPGAAAVDLWGRLP